MDPLNNPILDQPPPHWSGLRTRVISAIALIVPAAAAVWVGGKLFMIVVMILGMLALREWSRLTSEDSLRWEFAGFAYALAPTISLIHLRDLPQGMELVLYLLFTVWATDIGAYFAGRAIGGPKLIPAISPNKTWAGLLGGMLAAGFTGMLCFNFTPYPATLGGCFALGMVLAVVAQAGDFFESWMKRRAGVKDSGNLIPGHGGLLDRIDGLMFSAPVFGMLVWLAQ